MKYNKHMPSTPMTDEEMQDQCDFISEMMDAGVCEITEDDEVFMAREEKING